MRKIITVIVTYNRKHLLLRCLSHIFGQTEPVATIIIIDNASTDGTDVLLSEQRFIHDQEMPSSNTRKESPHDSNGTRVHYVRLAENIGGAGGFEYGTRMAFEKGADFVWLMDDDGYPEEDCLKRLLQYTGLYDYILPISLDTENNDELSWYIKNKKGRRTKKYSELEKDYPDQIMPSAVPFNGLLLSRRILETVGFPKGEMFIWGDDYEHQYRCKKKGFQIVTLLSAKFFHPSDKASHYTIFFGTIPINYTDSKLHFTCLIRNSTFNYWNYAGKELVLIKFLMYSWFFLFTRKMDIAGYRHYLLCVIDGIKGRFDRHKKYLQ